MQKLEFSEDIDSESGSEIDFRGLTGPSSAAAMWTSAGASGLAVFTLLRTQTQNYRKEQGLSDLRENQSALWGVVKTPHAGPCFNPIGLGWSLIICISHKSPREADASGAYFENQCYGQFPAPPNTLPSNATDPYQLYHKQWKSLFMYITPPCFEEWKTNSIQSPTQPLDKTRLTSFQLLASFHPPLSSQPVSASIFAQMVRIVCVYTSPAPLVYMYTFVFLLLPH